MISAMEVLDAINGRLVERFPERTCYVDVCPIDFARPSFWLQVLEDQIESGNAVLLHHSLQLGLTLYDELDKHYDVSWQRLRQDAAAVSELLSGPLSVKERTFTLTQKTMPREADRVQIQLFLSWMDLRPGTGEEVLPPPAETVELRYQTKKRQERKDGNGTP